MRTVRIRVYGRVQGVGFRYYALYTARSLGITGYVRNEPDGSVEIVGSGRDPDIEAFIESIDRGPTYANVTKTEIEELPFMRFEYFEIR
ncbi:MULTISPECIES: acylphosphatase [Mesotoga]|jgi:acylphosphatase|uniref:Acylphosphatase n=1 Tax=Mesotoga prima MesG1.Ag.4.2 TaxID=660470 RepID=I2F5L1_9BACT|nr:MULTISPECIES: acylphosphatase [Mesotoga]MCP5457089.1 acylphosphatase [Thermotogota bacterium]CCU83899.1 Acylphosphatase [Mesotoga infera]AFK07214.1 acylphosphatase [Mesotoga prima MesG1.Ag.4.2]MCB1222421.1 acylphosphatase [Mesotoga sp.]MCP5460308.1 acylphosphatase [Thermotogota bacterium]